MMVENGPTIMESSDEEDELPLSSKLKTPKKEPRPLQNGVPKLKLSLKKNAIFNDDDSDDDICLSKRVKKENKSPKGTPVKNEKLTPVKASPGSSRKRERQHSSEESRKKKKRKLDDPKKKSPKKVKKEEHDDVWRWWEDESLDEDKTIKWKTLEHNGPLFAARYERLPSNVRFYYNGKAMKLSNDTEEVATFYGRMLDHDYTSKETFNRNFMTDWRKEMTSEERKTITDLKKCDFREIDAYFKDQSEKRKNRTKEEKQVEKEKNATLTEKYGSCIVDGHRQTVGNWKIEPPGLFRGRGDHPKMGKLKKRIRPEDVIINCSKGAKVPDPPAGHKWREVRHDNSVSWLASWTENVQGQNKYIMLNAASKLKGIKDWEKYEKARELHKCVGAIRDKYMHDCKSKLMGIRQRAVAIYLIDELALRAGNEKDEDAADTVGCCSLRFEHVQLVKEEPDGGQAKYVLKLDFLGKDSIPYRNSVPIRKEMWKNIKLFLKGKHSGDDLFDRLSTSSLNTYLQEQMDGLTAKVFRTYNASITLQDQLSKMTDADHSLDEKNLDYQRANRAVAILCNHQRAVPKNFDQQMTNLDQKIDDCRKELKQAKREAKQAKSLAKRDSRHRKAFETKKKKYERIKLKMSRLEIQKTDKDENKEIALGTSKLNYLDPRITVAWCKKWEVPIEKIYNKTQRAKFTWAIHMADEDFEF